MTGNYLIERITEERYKDLLPLYLDAFGKKVSLGYFQKKFDTSVFGAKNIGYIAYSGSGQAAAYYGLFPCRVMLDQKEYLSATSGDTMTHSAHRGKGLFIELAKRTYLLAKENGITFAYGFPNEHSKKGSVDLGWQYGKDHLKLFVIRVNTIPVSKIAKRIKLTNVLYPITKNISGFPNSLVNDHTGGVVHDLDYFNYKTYSKKSIVTIAGSRVWIKIDGVLKIGDVERTINFRAGQFLEKLKTFAVKRGIREIQLLVSNESWLDHELKKNLEGKNVFPVGHFSFTGENIDFSRMKYGMCDLDTF